MSPLYLAAAYAAGAATTYGVLYVRMRMRAKRAKRRVANGLDALIHALVTEGGHRVINLGVVSEGEDDAPPCDDPNCAGCVARRKAAEREQWSRN